MRRIEIRLVLDWVFILRATQIQRKVKMERIITAVLKPPIALLISGKIFDVVQNSTIKSKQILFWWDARQIKWSLNIIKENKATKNYTAGVIFIDVGKTFVSTWHELIF